MNPLASQVYEPTRAEYWHELGVSAFNEGKHDDAQRFFSHAIGIDPDNPSYYNNLGVSLLETHAYREAEAALRHALSLVPHAADPLCNLGRLYLLRKSYNQAIACFEKVLADIPGHAVALANKATVLQVRGQLKEAIDCYHRALAIRPDQANWWTNMGAAWLSLGNHACATTCFQAALQRGPDDAAAASGLISAHLVMGDFAAAAATAMRCLAVDPQDVEVTAQLAYIHQVTADWHALAQTAPRLHQQTLDALRNDRTPAEKPFANVGRCTDRRVNLAVARAWSRSIAERAHCVAAPFKHGVPGQEGDGRITVGYVSADFRNHAVAHQAAGLFRLHDRKQFRVLGFSVGPDDGSRLRKEIASSCDRFFDLAAIDTRTAAQTIYDQRVHILVDMMGHTDRNRLDILALRPAPIQVGYLGYLASTGAAFIDYLIGDRIVTPAQHADEYTEKLIRLPGCYQIISPTERSSRRFTRSEVGLPEKAFVFCCFNQAYKIDPPIFHCWMRILGAVPSAVLWLYRSHALSERHLRDEATRQGVSPRRLVFADKLPIAAHIQRLSLADLALDTPRYNGGATTANALSAGVPVIATMGDRFVSRMTASHLLALGLNALVVADLDAYARLAIELVNNRPLLNRVREKLNVGLAHSGLLDAESFVRNLQAAYRTVWRLYCQGRPAEAVDIDAARVNAFGSESIWKT